MPATILFIYCLVVAIFLTISGVLATKTASQYLFQLLFLPVSIYFIATALKKLRKSDVRTKKSQSVVLGISLCFFALLLMSVFRVIIKTQSVP